MNKLFLNLFALLLAFLIVTLVFFIFKDKILNYYTNSLDSLYKTNNLQSDLENGKIILFGSSELLYNNQKFTPQNFFNDLKIPFRVHGNQGHQEFIIMSQLAAYDNQKIRDNARVVIMLSPNWFNETTGSNISKFLEFMYTGMMNKLYFQSTVDDSYKQLIDDYVKKNLTFIKEPTYVYNETFEQLKENNTYLDNIVKKAVIDYIDYKNLNVEKIVYSKPNLNWDNLKIEAKNISSPSTNNSFGISNDIFIRYVEPLIQKGEFPSSITIPAEIEVNQEYKDFLVLLRLLKNYKIKPLFVMQDLHPSIFVKNRDIMNKFVTKIKSDVVSYGYGYYDMWSYNQKEFEIGTLFDTVHLNELGWVKVNQKIVEHFMNIEGK